MILIIRMTALLGHVLAGVRAAAGLSQMALGERAGIANSQISTYERALVTPDVETTRKLLDACGWQLAALPAAEAATYDQRAAVVEAVRQWHAGKLDAFGLETALGALEQAATSSAGTPPSPVDTLARLRRELELAQTQVAEYEAIFGPLSRAIATAHARLAAGGAYESETGS